MSKINAIEHEAVVSKVTERVTKNSNGKDHTTRYLVLENDDDYIKELAIELYGDKCDEVDNIMPGDNVKVWFNLSSREWNGRYFSSFKFWKIEKVNGSTDNVPEEGGDLPF